MFLARKIRRTLRFQRCSTCCNTIIVPISEIVNTNLYCFLYFWHNAQKLWVIFMNYYTKLKEICSEHETSPSAVVRKLGYSASKITAWKTGSVPNLEIAYLIAKELGEPLERFIDEDWQPPVINPEETELIKCFSQLDRSGRVQLIGKAYELIDNQSIKKGSAEAESENAGSNYNADEHVPAVSGVKE